MTDMYNIEPIFGSYLYIVHACERDSFPTGAAGSNGIPAHDRPVGPHALPGPSLRPGGFGTPHDTSKVFLAMKIDTSHVSVLVHVLVFLHVSASYTPWECVSNTWCPPPDRWRLGLSWGWDRGNTCWVTSGTRPRNIQKELSCCFVKSASRASLRT